jgi:hypothetical protein
MQSHLNPSTATQNEAKSDYAGEKRTTQLEITKKVIRDMIEQCTTATNPLLDNKDKRFLERSDVKALISECLNIHTRLNVLYVKINTLSEYAGKNNPKGILARTFAHVIGSLKPTTIMQAWEADTDKDYSNDFNQLVLILNRRDMDIAKLNQKLDETITKLNETRHELDQSRIHNVSQSSVSAALFPSAAGYDKKSLLLAIGPGRTKVIVELIKLKQGANAEVIKNVDAIIFILLKDACSLTPNKMMDLAKSFPACPNEIAALLNVNEEQLMSLKGDSKKKALRTINTVLKSKAYIALDDRSMQEIQEFARAEHRKIGEHKASQQHDDAASLAVSMLIPDQKQ